MKREILHKKSIYFFIVLLILCCLQANTNEITFPDEDENSLTAPSFTEEQIRSLQPVLITPKIAKTPTQSLLLREANIKRNGYYLMLLYNITSINRLDTHGNTVRILSSGFGLRGGMISYLDSYIGIRGYFGLDFTHDSLAIAILQQNTLKPTDLNIQYSGTMIMASLGIDILIDFFIGKTYQHTMGFFLGVGAGALIYFDNNTPMILANGNRIDIAWSANVTVQGGITMTLAHKNKFEIGVKLLPTQALTIDKSGVLLDFNPYIAYSYKF
ncbi:outer membrane beta-barrel protein [Helicobacter aurati]|uniref:Outer membrane beta-barrel protein n=1 Tax=Helicobacter aurati TaxID=137778 RepID=A0A3D8J5D0_9HELI|nr:outer membrane beta-barrel protein [Helicobacter aurati]RDU72697.1 outer membrane beta-barrel protein [Helicobacter aurati]